MTFFCVFMFGALLFLDAAVEAGKCPKMCTCDGAKLTVACVGKNLTEVPSTVDEVRPIYIFYKIVNLGSFSID
jgi:hypothetical protein